MLASYKYHSFKDILQSSKLIHLNYASRHEHYQQPPYLGPEFAAAVVVVAVSPSQPITILMFKKVQCLLIYYNRINISFKNEQFSLLYLTLGSYFSSLSKHIFFSVKVYQQKGAFQITIPFRLVPEVSERSTFKIGYFLGDILILLSYCMSVSLYEANCRSSLSTHQVAETYLFNCSSRTKRLQN